jgi:hypothetical protein
MTTQTQEKWIPMCFACQSGNISRITKGWMKCLDCGAEESPIDFFGLIKWPTGALFVQKGTETRLTQDNAPQGQINGLVGV